MSPNTSFYGYLPSEAAALFGIAFFGTSMSVCVLQVIFGRYRHYWMLTLAMAALGEAIGWGGRLWAHFSPANWMPFMIQICSLLVSPVFISAADYLLFCRIIEKADRKLFGIPSRFIWLGFIIFDAVSLAIQTVGGVQVSSAKNYAQLDHGSHTMLAGIIFQFSNTVVFVMLLFAAEVRLRRKHHATLLKVARWPTMMAMSMSTFMVLLRNGYRIAELQRGWKGNLMRTEGYFIGLDMVPMALAVGAFVVFPPSICFKREEQKESHMGLEGR